MTIFCHTQEEKETSPKVLATFDFKTFRDLSHINACSNVNLKQGYYSSTYVHNVLVFVISIMSHNSRVVLGEGGGDLRILKNPSSRFHVHIIILICTYVQGV